MKNNPDSLFEIKIRVNFSLLKDYFGSTKGFLRDITSFLSALVLVIFSCALQNSLPGSLPELPLFPAVIITAWLAVHRGPVAAAAWSMLAGFLLDCGTYSPLGMSSLILTISSFSVRMLLEHFFTDKYLPSCALAGAVSTGIWVILKLTLFSLGMPSSLRTALIPLQFFGGMAMGAFICAPLCFSLLDLLSRFLPQNHTGA